jgi:cytochrome P450
MDDTNLARPPVPDHVPPELVRDFRIESLAGVDNDPFTTITKRVRGGPDIFYGVNARRGHDTWVVTRHELIREVFQDADTFSSHHNGDFAPLIGEDWPMLPLEADPPEHANWRMLLNPIFAPAKMKVLEEQIETLAVELVEGLADKGETEFMHDFAEVFPIVIFLKMFGLPQEDAERFKAWENDLLHASAPETRGAAASKIVGYLREVIAARKVAPCDDLISYVVGAKVGDRAINDDEIIGVCLLLYVAGLDTVVNTLGFIFRHLAEHPDDQQMLRDHPEKIPNAIEEMLRAFPIVLSGRLVTRDIDFHGVKMKAGDRITLPTMLAGRDDSEFDGPDKVDFAREKVAHITFAAGPHRCVGSHLARRELRIALEAWLNRVPAFRIKPGDKPITNSTGLFGVSYLPLVWDPA